MYKFNGDIITVHCYVDQLISNTDGKFDKLGSAFLTLPKDWVIKQINYQGFSTFEDFINTYTFDDTDGWIDKAIGDAVILGVGTGIITN